MTYENLTFGGMVNGCRGYWPTHPPGSSYLWKFEGIPFNLFLNALTVPICFLLWLGMKDALQYLRRQGLFFIYHRKFKIYFRLGKRDERVYNAKKFQTHEFSVFFTQRTKETVAKNHPEAFLLHGVKSVFSRLSIINLSLDDSQGPWILWALTLTCSILYLVWIGLRFQCAYHWPQESGICRAWNERSHLVQDHSLLLGADNLSAHSISESDRVTSCQCLLVNQLPNVLMLSNVAEKPFDELKKDLQSYFSSFDPPVTVQWIRPLYDVYEIVTQERVRLETKMLLQLSEKEYERTGREPRFWNGFCGCVTCMKDICPYGCNYCCCLPCLRAAHIRSELAREVYRERILADKLWLDGQYKRLKGADDRVSSQRPIGFSTGVVFVGLDNADEALRVAKTCSVYLQRTIPTDYTIHPSTHTFCLPLTRWSTMLMNRKRARTYAAAPFGHLQLAPLPADILWTNLMTSRYRSTSWWITQLLKSILIFLLALLLTSPTYLIVVLNYIRASDWLPKSFGIVVYQWVPALVLVTAAASVKQLVIRSEAWTKHGTYGGREKVGQRTLFFFLLISVLLFPSLGVTGPKEHYAAADRLYHMTWFIQSNNLSMAGICLACMNLSFFFVLRIGIQSAKPAAIAFIVLAVLVVVTCILLSSLMDARCVRIDWRCASPIFQSAYKVPEKPSDKSRKRSSAMIPGSVTFSERVYTAAYLWHRSSSLSK
ncbi:hypothetical protein D915_004819 [Fasciola hepatica]|uniref:Uncharacterized protein n=1 Tax=Fasciola hepatica TaxID=6192 RepID=A0A4E0RCT5_FASHE|nr:hypothetical protein D915_004819 [Fasciola hepatica]